jgi:integrase
MGKLPKFPHELKFGGSVVRIVRDPLRIPLKKTNAASGGPSRPTHKVYESYIVEYFAGPKRMRVRRSTYAKAMAFANEVGVQLLNNDIESLKITGADRRAYLIAIENLKGLDKPLDHVTKEFADAVKLLQPLGVALPMAVSHYVEAVKKLGKTSLATAVEFFERHGGKVKFKKTVPEVVQEFLVGLRADGAGKYHLRDTEARLDRFAKDFPGPILEVSEAAITVWLRNLRALPGRRKVKPEQLPPLGARSRNHYRNSISALFNFARRQNYLPRDLTTAVQGIKLLKTLRGENEIFTPEQIEKLLAGAPDYMVPGLAVKAFSGVRTEEIAELDWTHILFDQDCIKLPAEITKLGQRRLIFLHPNLKAWLEPHRKPEGRLCERWTTPQSIFQAWSRYAEKQKLAAGTSLDHQPRREWRATGALSAGSNGRTG